jgi:gas vesicle structural protein
MPLQQPSINYNMIDVLDRVLDKGIVVDAWMRISLAGINLITIEARVVVASIETYLTHAPVFGPVDDRSTVRHLNR